MIFPENQSSGYSLIEMMVGLAVASTVMLGTFGLMLQLGSSHHSNQLQTLINTSHFLGIQVVNNPVLFANRVVKGNPLAIDDDLKACLAGTGRGCDQLTQFPRTVAAAKLIPVTIDDSLNASVNLRGRCLATESGCLVQRTASYFWSCPADTYCTGLNVRLRTAAIHRGPAEVEIRDREANSFIPARQFQSHGEVAFQCQTSNSSIFSVDHVNSRDVCATYPATTCTMPVTAYLGSDPCRVDQVTDCSNGYGTAGLFNDQASCAPTVAAAATPAPTAAPSAAPASSPVPPAPVAPTTGRWVSMIPKPMYAPSNNCPNEAWSGGACRPVGATCRRVTSHAIDVSVCK